MVTWLSETVAVVYASSHLLRYKDPDINPNLTLLPGCRLGLTLTMLPLQLQSLTPLHIAASLPGEEGVKITELLLHAVTNVDARAADQDYVYKGGKVRFCIYL